MGALSVEPSLAMHRDAGHEKAGLAELHISGHWQAGAALVREQETQQSGTCSSRPIFAPRSTRLQGSPERGEALPCHPPSSRGKDPSRGWLSKAMKLPPMVQDFSSRGAFSVQLLARPLMRTMILVTPALLPVANTRCMHLAGERPREQNFLLWSEEDCQMGFQPTWEPTAAAGDQQVSSGGLQVYTADMSIWGEITTFALKPQRG